MANSIAYTRNYTAVLDEVYKRAACSTCLNSPRRMARAGRNAKEIMVPKIEVSGLGDYTRNVGYQPWYEHRHDVEAVDIAADIAGVGNLNGVRQMQYTFNSCAGLTEVDLSELDPSSLEDLAYTFGGCGSLVTIWADADWALPASGLSGFQTFYQCTSLVGGARTTYTSLRADYQYMRIDGVGGAGYLTAKGS